MEELLNLYKKYWKDILDLKKEYPGLSNPLLINISNSYLRQKVKLFVVGQETNGWLQEELGFSEQLEHIDKLIEGYKDFNFNLAHRFPSVFWNVVEKIEDRLNIDKGGIVWSNLNRMDYNNTRPPEHIKKMLYQKLPLLPEEIKVAKPDLVIFFTGPDFDYIINVLFNNPEMTPFPDKEIRKLAKVSLKGYNLKAYRTDHPGYLRFQKLEDEIINLIIEDFHKS